MVSEPNRLAIEHQGGWVHDIQIDTAIKIMNSNVRILEDGHGPGYTYVKTPELTIYSCYSSGNQDIKQLEDMLQSITDRINTNKESVIITGDFNAKSPQWGMHNVDNRGQIMMDWIAEVGLIVVNTGAKPTFERPNYGSILDLTIVTEDVKRNILSWEVTDAETLSDHNYVVTEMASKPQNQSWAKKSTGWSLRKLDGDKLKREIDLLEINERTTTADGFSKALTALCNRVLPKKAAMEKRRPAYWWSEEIAQLRRECNKSRRIYTRSGTQCSKQERKHLWNTYAEKRKQLRYAITKSKRSCWKSLCDDVDKDPWGNGYKIVMNGIKGKSPRTQLHIDFVNKVANHLFPAHSAVSFQCKTGSKFIPFTADDLNKACNKLKAKKAPGPGQIPPEIIKAVAKARPSFVLKVYNQLAENGFFPEIWKRARLILLRKGNKPIDEPSSYRPICLLDVEGKLYEQLLLVRLKDELKRVGDLSDQQYGFREGRQTVDAIKEVVKAAKSAAAYATRNRRVCAMITLDVSNAFNCASWQIILDELRRRGVDEDLITKVASYLSDRVIILQAGGEATEKRINSGVPQGSVLGPFLWNLLYDEILHTSFPSGVKLIGFADDIAMIVIADNEMQLEHKANTALQRAANWIEGRKLTLAPEKTEAVLLTTKRKLRPVQFVVKGKVVRPSNAVRYLGVWLDTKLTYGAHIDKVIEKAEKTVTALSGIMPNIRGPRASKRRTLLSVVHSQLLYAAPVWSEAAKRQTVKRKLTKVQRGLLIRVASAYRTISAEAVGVIAGVAPIDLIATERSIVYEGQKHLDEARQETIGSWQKRWESGQHGRWTHKLIPDIKAWVSRTHGEVDYYLTQALSGHGCFMDFLFKRTRAETDRCLYCGETDTADHTLFRCNKWEGIRSKYEAETGVAFEAGNIVRKMIESKLGWRQTYQAIRGIIEQKESDVRAANS